LESLGFKVMCAEPRQATVIAVADLAPVAYKLPDLLAVKGDRVAIVEVETAKRRFFDALGRCLVGSVSPPSYIWLTPKAR
jgi:hypothetical protein